MASNDPCRIQCGPSCEWIFDRIRVWPLVAGDTRVEWTVHPQFTDPLPHTFQLQMGHTSNPEADDWCDVGLSVVNGFFAIDPSQRIHGKFQWTHYRIVMTTVNGIYASKPQHAMGDLSKRDWLRAREILRMENIRLRKEAGQEGYLLKRKLFGTVCTCLDTMTKEVRDPNCTECFGTGFIGGYFDPYPCFYVELDTHGHRSHQDDKQQRGTVDDLPRVRARMLNIPQVFSYDVWVDRDSDNRWVVHTIKNIVEIRGVPIVLSAELRLAPYTHPIYSIEIVDQVPQ